MTTEELRRHGIILDLIAGRMDGTMAAKSLNLSVRQTKRLKAAVKANGAGGVIHGSRGRKSNRRTEEAILSEARKLLNETYYDFNPLLAQEHLAGDHGIRLSRETVRHLMIGEGLWHARKRGDRSGRRSWRERKDNYGEMVQFDGSYHDWFEGRNREAVGDEQCLLVAVDDATGRITKAKFGMSEGVVPVFKFWKEYAEAMGRPISIYLDRFSTYKVNHKNAADNKELMTQFERAMGQLGVRVIHANSPQAKGRVEKMNGTLQRRLVKEMRLAGINAAEAANEFLERNFIPAFNAKFAVVPKKPGDLHRKPGASEAKALQKIFSVQSERTVGNDYVVRFKNSYYQLAETQPTTVYRKDRITVEEHLNGEVRLAIQNHYLDYFPLPERPKKEIDVKLAAITRARPTSRKPPPDHPWRRPFTRDLARRQSSPG